jgi:hypothetical protein
MASAFALEHDGLRLRSRRSHSGRSHRLPLALAVIVIATVGLLGARSYSTPDVTAATQQHQRLAGELRPIRAEMQLQVAQLGLAVTAYDSGQIDRAELQRRLAGVLAGYESTAAEVNALDPPTDQQTTVREYAATVDELSQSVRSLSRAYDDGDQAGIAQALATTLQAIAQVHDLSPATG